MTEAEEAEKAEKKKAAELAKVKPVEKAPAKVEAPVVAANNGLACKAAAILAVAAAEVVSNAFKVTLTPPITIVPAVGVPLKMMF